MISLNDNTTQCAICVVSHISALFKVWHVNHSCCGPQCLARYHLGISEMDYFLIPLDKVHSVSV